MNTRNILWSSVGKKALGALTGIALMLFLIVHLGGNLTLLAGGRGALFNTYAHHLEGLRVLVYLAEAGLILFFLVHVAAGISVVIDKFRARPERYAVIDSKGPPSKQTISSRSMIITGLVLLVFIPLHIWMFKFNRGAPHPRIDVHGIEMKDLYKTVVVAFQNPSIAWGYALVMFLLGFHLRHGFWSSLQSLGAMSPKWSPAIYGVGLVFALLMAGGFLVLPLYLHYFPPILDVGGAP